ncbi:MAG: hypothetical protein GY750_18935 [Lentisphaerae bacterium]|nr:hypothetical protein [Lentisphaerota bacterium]MCP4103474.1 hypothetical protein [Lentisphaerota bacterium]
MKTLIIVRHSKTEKYAKSDIERKLTDRGRNDAAVIGEKLKAATVQPEIILCSPAKRARKTARLLARHADYSNEIIVEDMALYTEDACEIIRLIRSLENFTKTLIVVGHNPVLLEIVNILSKRGIGNLRTSGVVKMQFDVNDWADISETTCSKLQELN